MADDASQPLLSQPTFTDGSDLTLLTAPRNVITKRIFVAATRMNEGKTTVCLGLFAALRSISPERRLHQAHRPALRRSPGREN